MAVNRSSEYTVSSNNRYGVRVVRQAESEQKDLNRIFGKGTPTLKRFSATCSASRKAVFYRVERAAALVFYVGVGALTRLGSPGAFLLLPSILFKDNRVARGVRSYVNFGNRCDDMVNMTLMTTVSPLTGKAWKVADATKPPLPPKANHADQTLHSSVNKQTQQAPLLPHVDNANQTQQPPQRIPPAQITQPSVPAQIIPPLSAKAAAPTLLPKPVSAPAAMNAPPQPAQTPNVPSNPASRPVVPVPQSAPPSAPIILPQPFKGLKKPAHAQFLPDDPIQAMVTPPGNSRVMTPSKLRNVVSVHEPLIADSEWVDPETLDDHEAMAPLVKDLAVVDAASPEKQKLPEPDFLSSLNFEVQDDQLVALKERIIQLYNDADNTDPEFDSAGAAYQLARVLANSEWVESNEELILQYFQKAADKQHSKAKDVVFLMTLPFNETALSSGGYDVASFKQRVRDRFFKAEDNSQADYAEAAFDLAELLEPTKIVFDENNTAGIVDMALIYYKLAADSDVGHPTASFKFASICHRLLSKNKTVGEYGATDLAKLVIDYYLLSAHLEVKSLEMLQQITRGEMGSRFNLEPEQKLFVESLVFLNDKGESISDPFEVVRKTIDRLLVELSQCWLGFGADPIKKKIRMITDYGMQFGRKMYYPEVSQKTRVNDTIGSPARVAKKAFSPSPNKPSPRTSKKMGGFKFNLFSDTPSPVRPKRSPSSVNFAGKKVKRMTPKSARPVSEGLDD